MRVPGAENLGGRRVARLAGRLTLDQAELESVAGGRAARGDTDLAVRLSLAELEMTRGADARAEGYARQALASAEASQELMTAALAHQTLGQLTAIKQDNLVTDQQP